MTSISRRMSESSAVWDMGQALPQEVEGDPERDARVVRDLACPSKRRGLMDRSEELRQRSEGFLKSGRAIGVVRVRRIERPLDTVERERCRHGVSPILDGGFLLLVRVVVLAVDLDGYAVSPRLAVL